MDGYDEDTILMRRNCAPVFCQTQQSMYSMGRKRFNLGIVNPRKKCDHATDYGLLDITVSGRRDALPDGQDLPKVSREMRRYRYQIA